MLIISKWMNEWMFLLLQGATVTCWIKGQTWQYPCAQRSIKNTCCTKLWPQPHPTCSGWTGRWSCYSGISDLFSAPYICLTFRFTFWSWPVCNPLKNLSFCPEWKLVCIRPDTLVLFPQHWKLIWKQGLCFQSLFLSPHSNKREKGTKETELMSVLEQEWCSMAFTQLFYTAQWLDYLILSSD